MPDDMTKKQRSKTMSRIRSKWTKQEKTIHIALRELGINHEMHPKIPGNPDLVVPAQKVAVFLNGCFWHKCPKCFKAPKSNQGYWIPKLEKNVKRDAENIKKVRNSGWKVKVIWEHEIKNLKPDSLREVLESKGISHDSPASKTVQKIA